MVMAYMVMANAVSRVAPHCALVRECTCVCTCACVRACVRLCVHVCACACVCAWGTTGQCQYYLNPIHTPGLTQRPKLL